MSTARKTEASSQIAVLSDIHANLHALDAVLAECRKRGVRRFYCLGDIVSYGAFPMECLTKIRLLGCPTVLGNHDQSVVIGEPAEDMNPLAQAGIRYSIAKLSADARNWLSKLPMVEKAGPATLVHASLEEPQFWHYVSTAHDAEPSFQLQDTPVCFYGHTHVPQLFALGGAAAPQKVGDLRFRLDPKGRCMLNPGSVGQPRNRIPDAQFAMFDPEALIVEFVRVPYDTAAAEQAIREAGLPGPLGERLRYGM